ncbi:hypothetical protein P170DRAFT_438314 [Aspergillus steynii IBT 23096]|uniref:Uncharacterized protein n=1 Tax=Aspergillus steynii IBT 23096 TaxID=1392250 RepID=A0A2I2G121_9EURO|nr:uncharacterized protein P170DRAFT_438314 [Aspergillus steynii IBT 23096]PLB46572.1 hypothetical protein P170DRAFT_438314 [Aspergillus steynii IBT 23096]
MLLVQPCKWDMRHFASPTCTPVQDDYPGPSTDWFVRWTDVTHLCAECHAPEHIWRSGVPVLVSPFRSVWAPEQTNPFLCDNCYSEEVRAKREFHPPLKLLKCLCVRRENLHFLLVNRRFYDEAARVFWTENVFAFENPTLLWQLLCSVRPATRDWITRISLMADAERGELDSVETRGVVNAMYWLRQCKNLTHLELDEGFLSRLPWVLKVKNVLPKTRVRFIRYEDLSRAAFLGDQCPPVWKVLYCRRDSQDPLAERLAVSMVRQRPLRHKMVRKLFAELRVPEETD